MGLGPICMRIINLRKWIHKWEYKAVLKTHSYLIQENVQTPNVFSENSCSEKKFPRIFVFGNF